jgi:hypothetical protein
MNWQNTCCRCFLRLTSASVLVERGRTIPGRKRLRYHGGAGSGRHACMDLPTDFDALSPEQLCALAAQLIVQVTGQEREAGALNLRIERIIHDNMKSKWLSRT